MKIIELHISEVCYILQALKTSLGYISLTPNKKLEKEKAMFEEMQLSFLGAYSKMKVANEEYLGFDAKYKKYIFKLINRYTIATQGCKTPMIENIEYHLMLQLI